MGRNSMAAMCGTRGFGVICVAQWWAGLSFEVGMFIRLRLDISFLGIQETLMLRGRSKVFPVLRLGHFLISKPSLEKLVKIMAAMLRVQLNTANSFRSGAQCHAEVTLYTS